MVDVNDSTLKERLTPVLSNEPPGEIEGEAIHDEPRINPDDTFQAEDEDRQISAQIAKSLAEFDSDQAALMSLEKNGPTEITITPEPEKGFSIIKEVMTAPLEIGPQIGGGIAEGIGIAAQGLADLGDFMDEALGFPTELPSSGNDTVDAVMTALLRPLDTIADFGKDLLGPPTSVIGGLTRETAKFLVAFNPFLRAAKVIGIAGKTTQVATAAAATGFTVQDPEKENLMNMLADMDIPDTMKGAFEILSINPDDNKIVSRAKNALIDAGFIAGLDKILGGLGAIVRTRRATKALKAKVDKVASKDTAPLKLEELPPSKILPEDLAPLGDVKAKLFETGDTKTTITGFSQIKVSKERSVFVNFAKVNSEKDLVDLIESTTGAFKGTINEARRGVITHQEQQSLADALGMTVDDLLKRNVGEAFNAEQLLAMRHLFSASGKKIVELAERSVRAGANEIDAFLVRKQMSIHSALEKQFFGSIAEAGRALGSLNIPVEGELAARAISSLMRTFGGDKTTAELAKRIAAASKAGHLTSARMAIIVRRGWAATIRDVIKESFVLGLLWDVSTHLVNTFGTSGFVALQAAERGTASKIAGLLGRTDKSVQVGEAAAMMSAGIEAIPDAIVFAGRAFKSGKVGEFMGKTEMREAMITAERIGTEAGMSQSELEAFKESFLGKAIHYYGELTRLPGRALSAEDEFAKTVAYRMDIRANAVRTATGEGLAGKRYAERVVELVNTPPAHMRLGATDFALYAAFQNVPGKIGRGMMMIRDGGSMNPIFLQLPFMRTPINLVSAAIERSPYAPLTARFRADFSAGGARREIALARMALGTMTMSMMYELSGAGIITGAGPTNRAQNEAWRREGNQPFSLNVGKNTYNLNRTDPIGIQLVIAATINEQFNSSEWDDEDMDNWATGLNATAIVLGEMMNNKTFFSGLDRTLFAIKSAQDGNAGVIKSLVDKTGASMMPFSSLFNFSRKFVDPISRQPLSMSEAVMAKIPGMSDNLLPRRDFHGQLIGAEEVYGRAVDIFLPSKIRRKINSPIDQEMQRLASGVRKILLKDHFNGVRVDFKKFPEAFEAYRILASSIINPAYGENQRDYLDLVVTGNHAMSAVYEIGSDTAQRQFIANAVSEYRRLAAEQMMSEDRFPAFTQHINELKQEQFAESLPRGTDAPEIFQ